MSEVFSPGPRRRTVIDGEGKLREVPEGWELLPPGDAAATRRVKQGPHWVVQEGRGRKVFSRGVWAPAERIAAIRGELEAERSTGAYARKLEAGRARRAREQARYEGAFERAVLAFLAFHPRHAEVAAALARRVTAHAVPVGSGTVARTERIPVERRAEAAVIAWMRHQTTAYDQMYIPRVKGRRREVRRQLASRSREVLRRYRDGAEVGEDCPLRRALSAPPPPTSAAPGRSASPAASAAPKPRTGVDAKPAAPVGAQPAAPVGGQPAAPVSAKPAAEGHPAPGSGRAKLFARLARKLDKP